MLTKIPFLLLGVGVFKFLFWKRLKNDYEAREIFTTSFYLLLGLVLGALVAHFYFPDWWFWLDFLGLITGLLAAYIQYEFKLFEVFEASVISSLFLLFVSFLHDALFMGSGYSGIASLVLFVLFLLSFLIDKRYKNISWYKSGKVGFTGISIFGLFFILRASVAISGYGVLSFVGKIEAIIDAVVAFASFMALFHLSRQVT